MNIPLPVLFIGLSALLLLTVLFALPQLRDRLVGNSKLRNALLPLATALVLAATGFTADILKGKFQQNAIPEDILSLYVQKVDFGVPQVPYTYRDRHYGKADVDRLLAPLKNIHEDLQFTDEERARLDEVANASGVVDSLPSDQFINTSQLAQVIEPIVDSYFDYTDWSTSSLKWANLIDSHSSDSRIVVLQTLIAAMYLQKNNAGLFQNLIGMAWRHDIFIPSIPNDCSSADLGLATIGESQNAIYVEFQKFTSVLVTTDQQPERIAMAREFGDLFRHGCLRTLSQVFRAGSSSFKSENTIMDNYMHELNGMLAAKQPESIRLTVAISNVGQFNSFVRDSGKVAVGPVDSKDKLSFVVHSVPSEESGEGTEGYIQVNSRATKTVVFYALLTAELRPKLYGAYESQQAYLRLGLVASAGAGEGVIFSQIAPFSAQAENDFNRKVEQITIKF